MREFATGEIFAGHRIDGVAGQGGMGIVYRATDLRLKRVVALKLIAARFAEDPEFRRRFERESELAASIRNANVITVYSAGEHEGLLFITMDYIEGTDLREMISYYKALDPVFVIDVIAQVADALDAAHAHGLIHRDVKPANILLGQEAGAYRAYLTDFGLTKRGGGEQGSGLTQAGTFVGTLDYVAPEQLKGDPVDARTDVYSLSCVLYEALSGQVPYPRDSEPAKMWAHASEPPPRLAEIAPHLPPAFDALVQRGMAKDPNDRPQTAGALAEEARRAAGARDEAAPAAPPPPPTRRPPWLAVGAAVAALVVVVVVLVVALGGGGGGSSGPTPGFEAKVGAICRDRVAQIKAYLAQIASVKGDSVKAAALLGQFHDAAAGLHDQLAALTPPAAQAAAYDVYLQDAMAIADSVAREQQDITAGNAAAIQNDVAQLQAAGAKADADGTKVPALGPCVTG